MRPIFTVHAGEYLVGDKIEKSYPDLRVWIPSKDTGIDLLVTDSQQHPVASIRVKFSKDYLASQGRESLAAIRSGGWWTINRRKLEESPADLWVMVLFQFLTRGFDFVVIPPKDLLDLYDRIDRRGNRIQSYVWVTKDGRCWETRGLRNDEQHSVAGGTFRDEARDLTKYLNAWPFEG